MTTSTTPAAAVSQFRKKPVVIEAVQFTQAVRDAYLFDGGLLPSGVQIWASNTHPGRREVYRADAYVKTLEGSMSVTLDDWIITGVNGEHYPCKPDIFAKTYEPAGAATARESALIAERDQLRAALLQAARDVEDLKRPVHMDDPESPQAARNSLYMSIAAKARGALSDLAAPAVEG